MMLYNTTFVVAEDVHAKWMQWVRNIYIKEIEENTPLSDPAFFKVMNKEVEGESYSLQFSAPSIIEMKVWEKEHRSKMEQKIRDLFGEKVLFFSTYLRKLI